MAKKYNSSVSFQTVLEVTVTVENGWITKTQYYMRSPAGKRVEVVAYLDEKKSTVDECIEEVMDSMGVAATYPDGSR